MPSPDSEEFEKTIAQILLSDIQDKHHVLVLMTNLEKIKTVFTMIMNETIPGLRFQNLLAVAHS